MKALVLSLRTNSFLIRNWKSITYEQAVQINTFIIRERCKSINPINKIYLETCISLSPESFPANINELVKIWETDSLITIF